MEVTAERAFYGLSVAWLAMAGLAEICAGEHAQGASEAGLILAAIFGGIGGSISLHQIIAQGLQQGSGVHA